MIHLLLLFVLFNCININIPKFTFLQYTGIKIDPGVIIHVTPCSGINYKNHIYYDNSDTEKLRFTDFINNINISSLENNFY
jgi:hypothetical protein